MYGYHIEQEKDQPGNKVVNPAHGQLNRENNSFPCLRSSLRIWSRETGLAVPSRVSLLISIIIRLDPVLTYGDFSRDPRWYPFIYLNRHTPSGQSRVYRAKQLRTDGIHCQESAGTGPVNLVVVPNGCCLGGSPWSNLYALLFPTPTIGMIYTNIIIRMCQSICWLVRRIRFNRTILETTYFGISKLFGFKRPIDEERMVGNRGRI